MPRTARHPLKMALEAPPPPKALTVTTIVYIPALAGYWEEGLNILKLFVQSVYKNTSQPFDLVVLDNGSCPEVLEYLIELKNKGDIQSLILSHKNLGKTRALNLLLKAAPGRFVTYADSDVYFLPGWFESTERVFNTFPKAGKVTALPIVMNTYSDSFDRYFSLALKEAQADPAIMVRVGEIVPDDLLNAHRLSLGETSEQYQVRIQPRRDIQIEKMDFQALISGVDFQFTISRAALDAILPLEAEKSLIAGDAIYTPILEQRLAENGYWQLSTTGYFVHHLGNHIPEFDKELPWLAAEDLPVIDPEMLLRTRTADKQQNKIAYRIIHNRFIRKFLKKVHLVSYRLLYE
jgi:glycosyltransferase involved in cell wall biosynthesis